MKKPRITCATIDWDTSDYDSCDPCDPNIVDLPSVYLIDEDSSLVKDAVASLAESGITSDDPDFERRFREKIQLDQGMFGTIDNYLSSVFGFCVNDFTYKITFLKDRQR